MNIFYLCYLFLDLTIFLLHKLSHNVTFNLRNVFNIYT
jgi:hypothetical protein